MGKEAININAKPRYNKLAVWGFVLACILTLMVIINILKSYSSILDTIYSAIFPISLVITFLGPILFILSATFSIIALVQIKKRRERGKLLAIVSLILLALLLLFVIIWSILAVITLSSYSYDPYKPKIETGLGDAPWCPKDLTTYSTYHLSSGYTVGTTGKVLNISGVDYCQYINTKSDFGDYSTEEWTSQNSSYQIVITKKSTFPSDDWEYCFYIDNQKIDCNTTYYKTFFS